MKNNNEILSIFEDEFIRLINLYNIWNSQSDLHAIKELVILCEEIEIPFDWGWSTDTKSECNVIESITISGKRIEFMKGEEPNAYRKEKIHKLLRDLLYDSI